MSSCQPTWFLTRGALAGICQVCLYITSHNVVTIVVVLPVLVVVVVVLFFCSCCCLISILHKVFQGETVVDLVDSMFLLLLMFL